MKKLFASLCLVGMISIPYSASASFIIGSTFPQQIVDMAQQAYQNIEAAVQTGLQYKDSINTYVLEPMIRVAEAAALQQIQDQTLAWVKSGFRGAGPAFIVNPDSFYKNIENQTLEKELNSIQANNQNIFSSGVAAALIQSVRNGRLPTGEQVQFTLGSTIQNSLCTEDNITRMATQAVDSGLSTASSSLSRDQQIAAKKNDLYMQLCSRSAANTKQTQQNLVKCFATDFNCGGWNAWLDLTQNPGNTEQGQLSVLSGAVNQSVNNDKQNLKDSMVNGLLPQTEGVDCMTSDADGEIPEDQQYCNEQQVTAPAAAISTALSQIQTGANQFAASVNEPGLGGLITALLQGVMTRIQQGFNTHGGTGVNSSSVGTITQDASGRYITSYSTSTYTGGSGSSTDLTSQIIAPLLDMLNNETTTLQKVQTNLTSSANLFTFYERDVNALEACYNTLPPNTNVDVKGGRDYIANVRSVYIPRFDQVKKDLVTVQGMLVIMSGYTTSLQTDPSTTNISNVANSYSTAISNGTLYNEGKAGETETDYNNNKTQVDDDRNKNLTPKTQECQQAQQQGGMNFPGGPGH